MASLLVRSGALAEIVNPKVGRQILALTSVGTQHRRNLNVQEHVSYTLLNKGGISTPKFGVAKSGKEAKDIATSLETKNLVLKAQVLAGGRGKGAFKNGLKGGVRVVFTPEEAEQIGGKMVNQLLVTKQTGPAGRICNSVMVAERKFPRREFYFAVMMERAFNGPVVIASSQGGVNIEEVAAENPDAIIYEPIDIKSGLTQAQAEKVVNKVGLGEQMEQTVQMLMNMYDLFVKKDALLIEINPYAEDALEGSKFFALDAKFRFDDNAEFRQKELFALRDWTQEDPKEVEAAKYDLNYIALDGSIGCMVNGAGLAMATMDIIKLYGGDPANFLDVGGGATAQAVKEAFKIITADPKVHCILVNIFGGIMRCDVIAEGIIAAARDLNMKMPIVCRLQGTNVNEARELIRQSDLRIIPRHDLDEAANLTVHLAKIVGLAREMKMDVMFEIPDSVNRRKCRSKYFENDLWANIFDSSVKVEGKVRRRRKSACIGAKVAGIGANVSNVGIQVVSIGARSLSNGVELPTVGASLRSIGVKFASTDSKSGSGGAGKPPSKGCGGGGKPPSKGGDASKSAKPPAKSDSTKKPKCGPRPVAPKPAAADAKSTNAKSAGAGAKSNCPSGSAAKPAAKATNAKAAPDCDTPKLCPNLAKSPSSGSKSGPAAASKPASSGAKEAAKSPNAAAKSTCTGQKKPPSTAAKPAPATPKKPAVAKAPAGCETPKLCPKAPCSGSIPASASPKPASSAPKSAAAAQKPAGAGGKADTPKPASSASKCGAAEPKPAGAGGKADTPKPASSASKCGAAAPKPAGAGGKADTPKPASSASKCGAAAPKPAGAGGKADTPKPASSASKCGAAAPKPASAKAASDCDTPKLCPKAPSSDSKPASAGPKPASSASKCGAAAAKPASSGAKTASSATKPTSSASKCGAAAPKPSSAGAKAERTAARNVNKFQPPKGAGKGGKPDGTYKSPCERVADKDDSKRKKP